QRLSPTGAACTPTPSVPGDGIDNDCDGRIDEEQGDGVDQDLDGLVDEDLAPGQTAINVPPKVADLSLKLPEDSTRAFVLTGSDRNGNSLPSHTVPPPAHGGLTGTTPALTYVPDLNYFGPASFTYAANDGIVASALGTYTIDVTFVEDPPVITS